MAIPKNMNKDHVIEAIKRIDDEGVPERRSSTRFSLSYEGKYYPPKYVISIANIFANGEEYSPSLFSGGDVMAMGSVPRCSEALLYWGTDPFIPYNEVTWERFFAFASF